MGAAGKSEKRRHTEGGRSIRRGSGSPMLTSSLMEDTTAKRTWDGELGKKQTLPGVCHL